MLVIGTIGGPTSLAPEGHWASATSDEVSSQVIVDTVIYFVYLPTEVIENYLGITCTVMVAINQPV